jgi:hypothetical protein
MTPVAHAAGVISYFLSDSRSCDSAFCIQIPSIWMVSGCFLKIPDREKLTLNLGFVDLGRIDLLVPRRLLCEPLGLNPDSYFGTSYQLMRACRSGDYAPLPRVPVPITER